MTDPREHKEATFIKVTDRRRFTSSGTVRPDAGPISDTRRVAPEPPAPPAAAPRAQTPTTAPAVAPKSHEDDEASLRVDFLAFVATLATNALAALGALPPGQGPDLPRNPNLAREYIDIIVMLERRTRGNLNAEEAATLKQLLADLHLQYVEATRSVQPIR